MRFFFGSLLLLGSLGLYTCSTPSVKAPSTATPSLEETPRASGTARGRVPGPDANHRSVRPENVRSQDTAYAATLPVLDDPDGTIRIRVTVDPRAHTPQKISLLFASHQPPVAFHQIGEGVGTYDAKTGHYYFNTVYQRVRQLANGYTDNGQLQEISGWVDPTSSTAAVAHKGASSEE